MGEKPEQDLFTVDLDRNEQLLKKFNLKPTEKRLKADEIIAERSAIPAVSSRKRPAVEPAKGTVIPKRHKHNWVPHKVVAHLREVANRKHDTTLQFVDATYDVWAEDDGPGKPKSKDGDELDFLPEIKKTKAPKSMAQKPISLAANGRSIPAVSKPSGGYSYNPRFSDYQARYIEVSNKIVKAEKKRLLKQAKDEQRRIDALRSLAEAEAAEARADMSEWEDDTEWEGFESEGEGLKTAAKRPQRKTRAQRNRIKRRKAEEARLKYEAPLKRRDQQAHHIKEIAKEVEGREKQRLQALAAKQEKRKSKSSGEGHDEDLRRKKLGRFHIPEKDLELVLPDELQESLRLLKSEGNLLKDRVRSLLIRGKLETRRLTPPKKRGRYKLTEKWSFKDFRT